MLAPQAHGHSITTVEGLAARGDLHPVQQAFRDAHALQCGYCTPGFLLGAVALANRGVALEGAALRDELAGNLCRCTGYQNIVEAVERYLRQAAAGRRDG
jgi:carbon-monoxide dehydrogenase small subunit